MPAMPPTMPCATRSRTGPGGQHALDQRAELREGRLDEIHRHGRQREQHPEERAHRCATNAARPKTGCVSKASSRSVAPVVRARRRGRPGVTDAATACGPVGHVGAGRRRRQCAAAAPARRADRRAPGAARRARGRCAPPSAPPGRPADAASAATSMTRPRRCARSTMLSASDHAQAAGEQLADEHQVAREVARVDDHHDGVGRGAAAAGEHGGGDARFGRVEVEVVDAGQIEHVERAQAGAASARPVRTRRWWCRGSSRSSRARRRAR